MIPVMRRMALLSSILAMTPTSLHQRRALALWHVLTPAALDATGRFLSAQFAPELRYQD
jgi:hypothetical protein